MSGIDGCEGRFAVGGDAAGSRGTLCWVLIIVRERKIEERNFPDYFFVDNRNGINGTELERKHMDSIEIYKSLKKLIGVPDMIFLDWWWQTKSILYDASIKSFVGGQQLNA